MKNHGCGNSVVGFYTMVGNERKKYRAKGRVFHYGAMLDFRVRSASEKPNALSADSSAAVSFDKGDLL